MHLVAGSDLKAMSHESSALAELQLLGGEPHTLGSMAGYAIWMMDPIRKVVTGLSLWCHSRLGKPGTGTSGAVHEQQPGLKKC